jgi:autotransporter passenger strand-loop-strand repeat protein
MTGITVKTIGGIAQAPSEIITPGSFAVGVNISGMEYGGGPNAKAAYTYVVPTLSELTYYKSQGQDVIRLPISWESLQTALNGPLTASYLANIMSVVNNAAALGMKIILDVHDFGGYNGVKIGTAGVTDANFANLWKQLATAFAGNPGIGGYDLMNEPSGMPTATAWTGAAQAAITAIRAVDPATTIYVEGNDYSNAQNWAALNPGLAQLQDPSHNLVFSAHVYLDTDDSGTHFDWAQEAAAGETTNIGVDRLSGFVAWLKANNLKGDVGEVGVGNDNPAWLAALDKTLAYAQASSLQVTYWAGGAWWGNYPLSVEPVNGVNAAQMAVLDKYSGAYPDVTVATLSGTADPNATIYLSENGVILATATANSAGAWSDTLTGLANGVHIIVAGESLPTVDGTIAATVFNLVTPNNTLTGNGAQLVAAPNSPTFGATIVNGGTETVTSGGTSSGTTVSNGGLEVVSSGGTALNTVVASGGMLVLLPGGVASGTVVAAGGNVSESIVVSTAAGFVAYGSAPPGLVVGAGYVEYVLSGGTASGTVISSGGMQFVYSGGLANSNTVGNGGTEIVSAGGNTAGSYIGNGGVETVSSGGTATGTKLGSGGALIIAASGHASGTVLTRGGVATVTSGGIASGSVVSSGGSEIIASGGVSQATAVASGGVETVSAGGVASSTVVNSGGTDVISSGGIAAGTVVNGGSAEVISAGGQASATVVNASAYQIVYGTAIGGTVSGFQTVSSGGVASGTAIAGGGVQKLFSGGIASLTQLGSGANEYVSAGAQSISTVIGSGGTEVVYPGGTALATMVGSGGVLIEVRAGVASGSILAGGTEDVASGGQSNASLIGNFGSQVVGGGGVASGAVISAGGSEVVSSGGTATGTVISSGGTQIVLAGGKTSGTTIMAGGTEILQSAASALGPMTFLGNNGTLSIAGTSLPSNVISGFDANGTTGDEIVLTGFTYSSSDSVTLSAGNVLTVDLNGKYMKMQFNAAQSYSNEYFAVEMNGAGQVVIVDPPGTAPVSSGSHAMLAGALQNHLPGFLPVIPKIDHMK